MIRGWAWLLFAVGCLVLRAEAADSAAAVETVNGISVLRIPLNDRGGLVIPHPEVAFSLEQGALAVELTVSEFPSRAIVVDLGNGPSNHLQISELYDGKSSGHGCFRFTLWDSEGALRTVDGPMLAARRTCWLGISYSNGTFHFWADGHSLGCVQGSFQQVPDRIAVVDPIGIRWRQIGFWSGPRTEAEFNRLISGQDWPFQAPMTFFVARHPADRTVSGFLRPDQMLPGATLAAWGRTPPPRALMVDAATNRADGDGSEGKPFKTISQAAAAANPGDTVVVAPGLYRESVNLTKSGRAGQPIRFYASPHGAVTIDGADPIGGFQPAGQLAGATLWARSSFHTRDIPYGDSKLRAQLQRLGPAALKQLDRRGRVDALWCDDGLVPKVDTKERLRPNSFWVDRANGELLLALAPGDRPENHRLEMGARGPLISGSVSEIEIRGFRLQHDDAPIFGGAIELSPSSSHWLIENVQESGGNWSGIRLGGWGHVLRRNTWENNGDDGIDGSLLQDVLVEGEVVRLNNWQRGISPAWGSGGVKLTQTEEVTFRGCEFGFNLGPGLWFDCNNRGVTVEACRSHHNLAGIFIEISPGPFEFRDNLCFANDGPGILVGESYDGVIEGNTSVRNQAGIELRNIPGRDENAGGAGCGLVDAGTAWKTADIRIRRNILADNSVAAISTTHRALDPNRDRIRSDSNLFFHNGAIVAWAEPENAGRVPHMGEANDWVPPASTGGQAKLLSLQTVHRMLGWEAASVEADPQFSYPAAYEFDSVSRQPAP